MARYRLLADCYLNEAHHPRGSVVEMPDNWKGPTTTAFVKDKDGRHMFIDRDGFKIPKLIDVPLFIEENP